MKNLKLSWVWCGLELLKHLKDTTSLCQYEKSIYWISDEKCWKFEEEKSQVVRVFDLPTDSNAVSCVSFNYVWSTQQLCVSFKEGSLYSFDVESKTLKCMGVFESGIECCEWSPDMELLVVITGKGTLVLLTMDYDVLSETELHQEVFGLDKQVSVGWGNKSTQFHGSEGKAAAKTKTVSETQVLACDSKNSLISWRGDGQMFSVSAVDLKNVRKIRIFNRDGQLLSTGESIPNIEGSLSWKPSGSLIASSQKYLNKHSIIFIEKNGLQHGQFDLKVSVTDWKVLFLSWSSDSTVLMVWMKHLINNSEIINLWTSSNYHWYLKYSIKPLIASSFTKVFWDSECHTCLHILESNGFYRKVSFSDDICCGSDGTVAVIDGSEVHVTCLSSLLVPPPLSCYSLEFEGTHEVLFLEPLESFNKMDLLISDSKQVHLYSGVIGNNKTLVGVKLNMKLPASLPKLSLKSTLLLPETIKLKSSTLHHYNWISFNELYVVNSDVTSVVFNLELNIDDGLINIRNSEDLGDLVKSFKALKTVTGTAMLYQLSNGQLVLDCEEKQILGEFPNLIKSSLHSLEDKVLCVFLTYSGILYCDGNKVDGGVTSYCFHSEFLLYTTSEHKLKCLLLHHLASGNFRDFVSCRNIERGGTLVSCDKTGTQVVLQMPRGNLEAIHPRCLVLSSIAKLLDQSPPMYKDAFCLMKKHRINLNLMFDHNPGKVVDDMKTIVMQLENSSSLCLLLSEVVDEDFCHTMYSEWYNTFRPKKPSIADKINVICGKMREALLALSDPHQYVLPLLTTHLKQGDLESALMQVICLPENSTVTKDEAVQYLTYSVNIEALLDIAMGTYNLDAVLTVAEKSQRDPKLYLPFLRSIQHHPEKYRRYLIDKQLNRPLLAVKNLACLPEKFDELLVFVSQEGLYKAACENFEPNSKEYKVICRMWAENLGNKKCYREAGLLYRSIGEHQSALDMLIHGTDDWRLAFSSMETLNHFSSSEKRAVVDKVLKMLKGKDQYSACAEVYMEYLNDVEKAVGCLVEGHLYQQACGLIAKAKRFDLMETHVNPKSCAYGHIIKDMISSLHTTISENEVRLQEVRQEKKQKEQAFMLGEERLLGECDLYSDVSSVTGTTASHTMSSSSFRSTSSKSKKKHNKKKLSTKRGSPFEDLGLIVALHQNITRLSDLQGEICQLLPILISTQQMNLATIIQKKFLELKRSAESKINKIWPPEVKAHVFGPDSTVTNILARNTIPDNCQNWLELDPVYRYPPTLSKDLSWIHETLL